MKTRNSVRLISALCVLLPLAGQARQFNAYTEEYVSPFDQDDWTLEGPAHELGVAVFPQSQTIASVLLGVVSFNPCALTPDNPAIPNYQIRITNLTGVDWTDVYYVADPETMLTNVDEWLGETASAPGLAFKIDAVGLNIPLVSEDIATDGIFQAGESWEFVIQDFTHPSFPGAAGGAEIYDSLGIAGASPGYSPSTGSIVAVPEPATAMMLFFGGGVGFIIHRLRRWANR